MVVPPTALNTLRKELRKRREAIGFQQRIKLLTSDARLENLIIGSKTIGLYAPMRGEPDPSALIDHFNGVTSLPALSDSYLIVFRLWSPGDPLVQSRWGGRQPADDKNIVIPDLIIVPLLGFDSACNRIGQGGGHYDRYLAAHPDAVRIGLAWEAQRLESIAPQHWDIPLDAVLTEDNFYVRDLSRCLRP